MPKLTTHQASLLLLEDDEPTRRLMTTVLQNAGYSVTIAVNRPEILRAIQFGQFDLVVTDVFMPDIDGLEIIQAVRKFRPNIPVLAMSGGGPHMPVDLTLRVANFTGARAVLLKPFHENELLAAVKETLSAEVEESD